MNVRVLCDLNPQQRKVLELVANGETIKAIAPIMHVSIKTVEYHYKALRQKLNMGTVAELTKFALHLGITEPYLPK